MRTFKGISRTTLAIQIALSLMLVSCDKTEAQHPIVGKWWTSSFVYWAGGGIPPLQQSNEQPTNIAFLFSIDGQYKIGIDSIGNCMEEGHWSIGNPTFNELTELNLWPERRNGLVDEMYNEQMPHIRGMTFRFSRDTLIITETMVDSWTNYHLLKIIE